MGLIWFWKLIYLEPLGVLPSNCLFPRVLLLVVIFCACFLVPVFGTCNCLWFSMDSTIGMLEKITKFMESWWPLLDPARRFRWLLPIKEKAGNPVHKAPTKWGSGRVDVCSLTPKSRQVISSIWAHDLQTQGKYLPLCQALPSHKRKIINSIKSLMSVKQTS